jgi:hypothetical protein
MNKWIEILKTKPFSMGFAILLPYTIINILRKSQEHQEHFMVFGEDFDQTLRTNLARHEVN